MSHLLEFTSYKESILHKHPLEIHHLDMMPGLMLCGRRWLIASDDIFIPSICFVFIHGIR